jgi:hypothetical protein
MGSNALTFPKVDIVMTTCKRIKLFRRTIESFYEHCLDVDLLGDFIIGDDGSSEDDIKIMSQYGTVYKNPGKGHPSNLDNIYSMINTEYAIHLEDDWEFVETAHFVRDAFRIMWASPGVNSVVFHCIREPKNEVDGIRYFWHRHDVKNRWSYSLNPNLFHAPTVKEVSKFEDVPELSDCFEHSFGKLYYEKGYSIATMDKCYCFHRGWEESAYDLNGTERH